MAENLEPLSDGCKKIHIGQLGLDATIDNLYKAEYSAGGTGEVLFRAVPPEENTDFHNWMNKFKNASRHRI